MIRHLSDRDASLGVSIAHFERMQTILPQLVVALRELPGSRDEAGRLLLEFSDADTAALQALAAYVLTLDCAGFA